VAEARNEGGRFDVQLFRQDRIPRGVTEKEKTNKKVWEMRGRKDDRNNDPY